MKKKIVGLLLIIAIFVTMAGLIAGRAEYVFSTKKFYDETEMEQSYNKGYEQGAFENRDEALYELLQQYTFENFELKAQNETLLSENSAKNEKIAENDKTIENLNNQINNLESNAEANAETIAELTALKTELQNQNKSLNDEISRNNSIIEENNSKIEQLQNNIKFYEDYIAGLETETEVQAIFVVQDKIYAIQSLNKGGLAIIEDPELEDIFVFKGWQVNGELVDITSYYLKVNTTFVALVEEKEMAGLFNESGEMIYSWKEMVSNNVFVVDSNGVLSRGSSFNASTYCNGSLVLPYGITEISSSTFYGCINLTSVTMPDSVVKIGSSAFYNCKNATINISQNIVEIGESAFVSCAKLYSVKIGSKCLLIRNYAFSGAYVKEVIIDSYEIYSNSAGRACLENDAIDNAGFITCWANSIYVLSSIDDGSNIYFSDTSLYTKEQRLIDGKLYNIYIKNS